MNKTYIIQVGKKFKNMKYIGKLPAGIIPGNDPDSTKFK